MISSIRPPALVAILLLFIGGGCAAGAGSPAPSPQPEVAADVERQGTVEEESNPDMDVRSWRLVPMNVSGVPFIPGVSASGRELRLGAVAMVTGPDHPFNPSRAALQLFFMGISDGWIYEDGADSVELRIDGAEPLHLPVVTYDESPGQGYVLETMGVPLPLDVLVRLSEASSAEGRLGPMEFVLGPEELERLGEFVRRLPPELLGTPI